MLYMFELQLQTPTLTQNHNSMYLSKPQVYTPSLTLNINSISKFQLQPPTQYFSSKHLIGVFSGVGSLELELEFGIWCNGYRGLELKCEVEKDLEWKVIVGVESLE